jgi:hypothetical protein
MFKQKDTGIQENTHGKKRTFQKDSTERYRYSENTYGNKTTLKKNSTERYRYSRKQKTERYRIKQNTYHTVTKEHCKHSTKIKVSTLIQQCQISATNRFGDAPNFHLHKDLEVVLVQYSDHSHQIVSPAECWKVRSKRLEIQPFHVNGLFSFFAGQQQPWSTLCLPRRWSTVCR